MSGIGPGSDDFGSGPLTVTGLLTVQGGLYLDSSAAYQDTVPVTSSASITVDWTAGNHQVLVLGHSPTIAFTDPTGPAHLTLRLEQDGAGARVFTLPTLRWGDGIVPRWSSGASDVDYLFLYFDGSEYWASAMVNGTAV